MSDFEKQRGFSDNHNIADGEPSADQGAGNPRGHEGTGSDGASAPARNDLKAITKTGSKTPAAAAMPGAQGDKTRTILRAQLGDEVYSSWFGSLEFEHFKDGVVHVSVPVKFLQNWITSHYENQLLSACAAEFEGATKVDISVRQPGRKAQLADSAAALAEPKVAERPQQQGGSTVQPSTVGLTQVAGLEGSPIDPRYTLDTFVIGPANRMAHAGASQVADTIFSENRAFNPFFVHSAVGLGKTHLLHAIAWEAKRRHPHANVLYLTAERFRYQFIEGLRSSDSLAFKDKFRSVDLLLIDDLEFMSGAHTEQEFDGTINMLLDSGRQIVVASARAPNHLDRLSERMRSRLQRGLVTEIAPLDYDLRFKVLEKRIAEKKALDPSFDIPRDVVESLANRLTESGRELEGAVIRLYAHWQYVRTPISVDVAETIVRDLINGAEPRRIKIDDILRMVARQYGVSKADLLSQRRHRSVVWPRQIGMFLAKQMTSRSLPEIGRRFGNRDHTTVLHAIKKIERLLGENPRLGDEIDELKKLLKS
ncbi:MAG: chromosomal replication initiator protein DnaA [Pseudomonadota bacterium]